MLVEYWRHEQHVRALVLRIEPEPAMRFVPQDDPRKRSEALAKLDLEVHGRLHLRRARVADDAAPAERARPELHAALVESDHAAVGDERRDRIRKLFPRALPVRQAPALQERLDLLVAALR